MWYIPDVPTKPNSRICTIPEFPQHFVARVENLSNPNWIELIRAIPGESLLFERFVQVRFGSREAHRPSLREL